MKKKNCIHHWVIETANGPTSQGVCATCGSSRDFTNSIGDGSHNHINLKKDESSNAKTSWMNLWPSSNIKVKKDGLR